MFATVAATVGLNIHGGVLMQRRIFAGLFLFYLFSVAGGGAQSVADNEKPVWTMESIKVKPGMLGITLSYLDDSWMRVREEAKRQGAVLSYHRIAEEGSRESDMEVILLTEYKNQASYDTREKLFASIRKESPNNRFLVGGLPQGQQGQHFYDIMNTRVFQDYSDIDSARFRLLSKAKD
jgi:hypothetical protein